MVSPEIFKQVYDSPLSLPGKHRWVTKDEDVRTIETLLGIPEKSIGAPLWVSGDTHQCPKCGRETNWLDIVSSALTKTHQKALLVEVILGERKYVNVEVPRAIADLSCYNCKAAIVDCAVSSVTTGLRRAKRCWKSSKRFQRRRSRFLMPKGQMRHKSRWGKRMPAPVYLPDSVGEPFSSASLLAGLAHLAFPR